MTKKLGDEFIFEYENSEKNSLAQIGIPNWTLGPQLS
jgi:hypothetical protein